MSSSHQSFGARRHSGKRVRDSQPPPEPANPRRKEPCASGASSSAPRSETAVSAALNACREAYAASPPWALSYCEPRMLTCHDKHVVTAALQYDVATVAVPHALCDPEHQAALSALLMREGTLGFTPARVEYGPATVALHFAPQRCPGPRLQLCSLPRSAEERAEQGALPAIPAAHLPRLLAQLRACQVAWAGMAWPLSW